MGAGSQFVPNYRSGGGIYVISLPALYDVNVINEAPVTEEKLGLVYNIIYCSEEMKNVTGEPRNQPIKLPLQYGRPGYNSESITYRHLVKVYQVLYGMPSGQTQANTR